MLNCPSTTRLPQDSSKNRADISKAQRSVLAESSDQQETWSELDCQLPIQAIPQSCQLSRGRHHSPPAPRTFVQPQDVCERLRSDLADLPVGRQRDEDHQESVRPRHGKPVGGAPQDRGVVRWETGSRWLSQTEQKPHQKEPDHLPDGRFEPPASRRLMKRRRHLSQTAPYLPGSTTARMTEGEDQMAAQSWRTGQGRLSGLRGTTYRVLQQTQAAQSPEAERIAAALESLECVRRQASARPPRRQESGQYQNWVNKAPSRTSRASSC